MTAHTLLNTFALLATLISPLQANALPVTTDASGSLITSRDVNNSEHGREVK